MVISPSRKGPSDRTAAILLTYRRCCQVSNAGRGDRQERSSTFTYPPFPYRFNWFIPIPRHSETAACKFQSFTVPRRLTAGSRKSSAWLVPRHSNNMRPCLSPFFGLPKKLRLMVYESLVTQHGFDITLHSSAKFATTLLPESIAPIYAPCKVVHAEAIPVLEKFNDTN